MEFLSEYGMFLLKCLTLVFTLLLAVGGILALSKKNKTKIELTPLNKEYEELTEAMQKQIAGKKVKKQKKKKNKKISKPTCFVLKFNGDIKASEVEQLRHEVTALLAVAKKGDEVVLVLESPGGAVTGYGLAASQLQRIRDRKIPLTVCIDKVAASGGYLMACIANEIVAAPFAIVGSIGVVSQIPNFHRWLKKHNIDVELMTAGEYKRTLTLLGENTEKGRQKFQEDLEKIHLAFRNFVLQHRANINIDEIATGEHWLAVDAFALRLIDKLKTSDELLIDKMAEFNLLKITAPHKEPLMGRLMKTAAKIVHQPVY